MRYLYHLARVLNSYNVFFLSQAEVDEDKVPLDYYSPEPVRLAHPDPSLVEQAAELLSKAERPLIVVGKGAAYGKAEEVLCKLVENTNIPFLPTPMGKKNENLLNFVLWHKNVTTLFINTCL